MSRNSDDIAYIEKIQRTYGDLNGQLHVVELQRDGATSLGLCLAGNRDLATMSIYVVGILPASAAAGNGCIHVGDELLEINGQVMYGRSHLNASAIIKTITSSQLKILLLRNENYLESMAVGPLRLPPVDYKTTSSTLIPKKPSLSQDEPQIQEEAEKVAIDELSQSASLSSPVNLNECTSTLVSSSSSPTSGSTDNVLQTNNNIITVDDKSTEILPPPVAPLENNSSLASLHSSTMVPGSKQPPTTTTTTQGRSRPILQKSAYVIEDGEDDPCCTDTPSNSTSAAVVQDAPVKDVVTAAVEKDLKNDDSRPSDDISTETSSSSSVCQPVTIPIPEDPATCPILPEGETVVDICKGKSALGLKIIGGQDTLLKKIVIYEIYKDGAAARDGRLWIGDQILEVNGEDLREVTHNRAIVILRKTTPVIRLTILRDKSIFQDESMYDLMTVELTKKPGKGLGLSITTRKDNNGIVVSDIVKGGVAEADGRLMSGDEILVVNGEDVSKATQEYAARLLKTSMGKLSLKICRLKVMSRTPNSRNASSYNNACERGLKKSESHVTDCKNAGKSTGKKKSNGRQNLAMSCWQKQEPENFQRYNWGV